MARAADSLPPLKDGRAPQSLDELWKGYDPRAEPLEATVVREWQEDGVTLRYVVFTVGTFKGRRSRIAAFYGFPKAEAKLPALLHLHGGGQRAFADEAKFAAHNGYVGLSINWGANPLDGGKEGDPNTDWGAVDPTQTGHNSHYASLGPDGKTLDGVESPRNNNWFLLVLAARRALTFLEQQPEVDAARLGVYGHSMGGKLTTSLSGIDPRVKVAAPSCGGSGSAPDELLAVAGSGLRGSAGPLHLATIDDRAYIPRITCPILQLAPTNDFNCALDSLYANWAHLGTRDVATRGSRVAGKSLAREPRTLREVRFSISPHLNHRHLEAHEACRILWFEQWLKGRFAFPATPDFAVTLDAADGVPRAAVTPDASKPVERVDIYYSVDPHVLTRFWRDARAERQGERWVAACPILNMDQPLFVLANVTYKLDLAIRRPRTGQPYEPFFAISSRLATFAPEALAKAGVKATDKPSLLIEDFARDWHDWYRLEWLNPVHWQAVTRKLKDPKWRGPDGARLLLDVRSPKDNQLIFVFSFNDWGAFPGEPNGTFAAVKPVKASGDWQTLSVSLDDLVPAEKPGRGEPWRPTSWRTVTELGLRSRVTLFRNADAPELVEKKWEGPREFRNLRWEVPRQLTAAIIPVSCRARSRHLSRPAPEPGEIHRLRFAPLGMTGLSGCPQCPLPQESAKRRGVRS